MHMYGVCPPRPARGHPPGTCMYMYIVGARSAFPPTHNSVTVNNGASSPTCSQPCINPTAAPSQFETLAQTSESRPMFEIASWCPHDGHADDRRSTALFAVVRIRDTRAIGKHSPELISKRLDRSLSNRAFSQVFRGSHVPSAYHAYADPFDTVTSPTCTSTAKHHPPPRNPIRTPRHQDTKTLKPKRCVRPSPRQRTTPIGHGPAN
jgi:hypothetical protein